MREDALKKRISELEKIVQNLEKDLIHDKLTGLKTRAFFEEEAQIYFDVAANSASPHNLRRKEWFGFSHLSFIFIDIDDFKLVNDTFGHLAGDEVLLAVAESIKLSVRDGDTAARWAGDEMAVALVGANEQDAFRKAEEIRRHVENVRFGRYPDLRVTISSGVATAHPGATFEDTLEKADKALYLAKGHNNKNRVASYSEVLRKREE
ncbi:MAG: GGDEF domain-containing protein [Minisyncoccota bacterium]